jgi:hypothetical protein
MILKLSNEPNKPDEATTGEASPLKPTFLEAMPKTIRQDFMKYQSLSPSSHDCYHLVIKPLRQASNIPIKP